MVKKMNEEEIEKITDFMGIYKRYLNPESNAEINDIIDYVIDYLSKVYLEYKDIIPYIRVDDVPYAYYIIKPKEGKYSLLDYLINTVIQNLDAIELINNKVCSQYNKLKKTLFINKKQSTSLHNSVFNTLAHEIDKEAFLKLYLKNVIYHEIGHMFHYQIREIKEGTVYVPITYMNPARKDINERYQEAYDKIKNRIALYSKLASKYKVLMPEEINGCDIAVEKVIPKYEEIIIPPILYINPVDEAFSECDAQYYSGLFENAIFEDEKSHNLACFYLQIDNEHLLMTYSPSAYSFSASIGGALKECISKKSYFRTVFLDKNDLFLEFLGKYDLKSVHDFSSMLHSADLKEMNLVTPLLDNIRKKCEEQNQSLDFLNIYFPLVYKDSKWVYYTDSLKQKILNK